MTVYLLKHKSVWIINLPILHNTGIYLCCSILQNQLGCYLRAHLWFVYFFLLVLDDLFWTLKQSNQDRIRWEGRGGHHLSQVESVRTWGANSFKDSYTWSRTLEEVWGLFPFNTYFFYLWKTHHCLLISGYFIGKIPAIPCVSWISDLISQTYLTSQSI